MYYFKTNRIKAVLFSLLVFPQTLQTENDSLMPKLRQFKELSIKGRSYALVDISNYLLDQARRTVVVDEEIKNVLLDELIYLNRNYEELAPQYPGEYLGEYYMEVSHQLGNVSAQDTRFIRPMIDALEHFGGAGIAEFLAGYGEAMVEPIINKYNEVDSATAEVKNVDLTKNNLTFTVKVLMDRDRKLSEKTMSTLEEFLLDVLWDPSDGGKLYAIDSLVLMKSKKAIPALIEISTNNPFIVYRIINEKKVPTYPLREKAEQALQMLR